MRRVLAGAASADVAKVLEVDPWSVRRWIETYERGGWQALQSLPITGRPKKLSPAQEKIIGRWLKEKPSDFGFTTDLWSAERLTLLVEQEFGIRFNADYFGTWLRDHGFSPQLPKLIPRERDPRKIAYWAATTWPRIQKMALKSAAIVAFIDESGVLMAPLRRRSWAQQGHPPSLECKGSGKRDKVSIAAAIWISHKPRAVGLFFHTLVNEYFNSFESACFVEALTGNLKRPVIVVWDRGSMHRGEYIDALKKSLPTKLHVEKLPPYAPMLNPVETLWCWLKYDRLCNFAASDVLKLNLQTRKELRKVARKQDMLEAFIRMSDLPFPTALLS